MDTHFGLGVWMEYRISPELLRCGCICSAITSGKPNPNRESSSCFAMNRGKRGGGGGGGKILRPPPPLQLENAAAPRQNPRAPHNSLSPPPPPPTTTHSAHAQIPLPR